MHVLTAHELELVSGGIDLDLLRLSSQYNQPGPDPSDLQWLINNNNYSGTGQVYDA